VIKDAQHHHPELSEALEALELTTSRLNFLREIVRPFRLGTEYKLESIRSALLSAWDDQQEVFEHQGIHVIVGENCAEGIIIVPEGFLGQISFCLFSLFRSIAPQSVTFQITESEQAVFLAAFMAGAANRDSEAATGCISTIQSYVEVLAGDFSIARDFSTVRISLPKFKGLSD
jgi:hypothetical protein